MKSKFKTALIAVVTTLALIAGGTGGLMAVRSNRSVSVYPVSGLTTTYTWGDSSESGGPVSADDIQSIYITSTQKITEVFVQEGDHVKAGDTILAFDTTVSELELTRKKIEVQQLQIDLMKAQKKRAELDTYGVGGPSEELNFSILISVPYLPFLRAGDGSEKAPFVFIWDESCIYDTDFIDGILPHIDKGTTTVTSGGTTDSDKVTIQGYLGDVTSEGFEIPWDLDLSSLYEDTGSGTTESEPELPDVNTDVSEPSADSSDATPSEESGISADSLADRNSSDTIILPDGRTVIRAQALSSVSGEENSESDPADEPSAPVTIPVVYAVFEVRQANAYDGDIQELWEICFWRDLNDDVCFRIFQPAADYDTSPQPDYISDTEDSTSTGNYASSWVELQKMKADADKEILELQIKVKKAELERDQMEYELSTGEVIAKIDGVVKTVRTMEDALSENKPLILLSAGGGYRISLLIGENDLDHVHVGDTVDIQSWESGTTTKGTILSISQYPSSGNTNAYYFSNGNSNQSTYPVVVSVDENANLRTGEYVSAIFAQEESSGTGFYLMNAFVRTENGRSYVWVRAEDGTLTQRSVQPGRNLWGQYTEILSGLSKEDYIAFPYGNAIREGAKTNESTVEALHAGLS